MDTFWRDFLVGWLNDYGEKGRFARRNPDILAGPVILLLSRVSDFGISGPLFHLEISKNTGTANGFAAFLGLGRNEVFTIFEPWGPANLLRRPQNLRGPNPCKGLPTKPSGPKKSYILKTTNPTH